MMENVQLAENTGEKPDSSVKNKGITGSTLKWIAVISMFIDHFGATVLGKYISYSDKMILMLPEASIGNAADAWKSANYLLMVSHSIMRMIGRIAFPIYCFLLVEGFHKSKNIKKYAGRLLIFALISEIPFDLAFKGNIFYFGYQNVFFTLFLGLITIAIIEYIRKNISKSPLAIILSLAAAATGIISAVLLHTDYNGIGVAIIIILYVFYENRVKMIVAGCLSFVWEITAPLAFIFIGFYNGERGKQIKYFFYAFYPLHLLLLYLIGAVLGLGAYSAR